jgi:transposase
MSYRPYLPASPRLIGYDPAIDLPSDHLARLVDAVVEQAVAAGSQEPSVGRPAFDLRLPIKVLVYGYATGVRSSRQLERLCCEHLAYLFLTRGDSPSYRTLCSVRVNQKELLDAVWLSLFAIAGRCGLARLGKIVIDSSKFRADASSESVLTQDEYDVVLKELERILKEVEQVDAREDNEGGSGGTYLGKAVPGDQMRDIVRGVRSQLAAAKKGSSATATDAAAKTDTSSPTRETSPASISGRMEERIKDGIAAIKEALDDGRKHLSLTDPDARMMPEGVQKKVVECHSFEVATDGGLIVAGETTNVNPDQVRLADVVAAAGRCEPGGITAVDADSGYYSGDAIAKLIKSGIDTCIPDGHTVCDLHRGNPIGTTRSRAFGNVSFCYDQENNQYTCPEGNTLRFQKTMPKGGQTVNLYVAERECTGCALFKKCITQDKAKHRNLHVGLHQEVLEQARERFKEPDHQERYHRRGHAIETVFGFIRSALGYNRWTLRGNEKVACEGTLFKIAYQVRKIASAQSKVLKAARVAGNAG